MQRSSVFLLPFFAAIVFMSSNTAPASYSAECLRGALGAAALSNDVSYAKKLLQQGAIIDDKNSQDPTPLTMASIYCISSH